MSRMRVLKLDHGFLKIIHSLGQCQCTLSSSNKPSLHFVAAALSRNQRKKIRRWRRNYSHVFNHMQEKLKGVMIDSDILLLTLPWCIGFQVLWMSSMRQLRRGMKWNQRVAAFIKILFDNQWVNEATAVYKEMTHSGSVPNCYTYTVLKCHFLLGSFIVFTDAPFLYLNELIMIPAQLITIHNIFF
jgi:pentatricopeptide repeat protein